ncbi:MAG: MFS transporter [Candidatus Norongarragalinales archaeon]
MHSNFFKGIKRNVAALGVVSALSDASSEMIFPLLPLFLSTVLGASAAALGLIEGVAESTAAFFKLASGWLSDKWRKRKPIIVAGYSLSAFAKPLFALAAAWQHVLAIRFLDRVGKGLRGAPRDAMIADSTPRLFRGKAFGFHRAMDTLGAVVGPALAFLALAALGGDVRSVFWLAAIPAVLSVAFLVFFVREQKPKARIGKKVSLKAFASLPKHYRLFVASTTIFALANFTVAFLLLRAANLGVAKALIPLVYLGYNLIYLLAAMPFGVLSDKIGGKRVLAFGYAAFAASSLGLALTNDAASALAFTAFFGLFTAANDTMQRVVSVDLAPPRLRASAIGLQQALAGAAALPASAIAGALWVAFSPSAAFAWGAVVSVVALTILAFCFSCSGNKRKNKINAKDESKRCAAR